MRAISGTFPFAMSILVVAVACAGPELTGDVADTVYTMSAA